MSLSKYTCEEFIDRAFSKRPTPGGGSAAALAGALAVALGGMVCNLTTGKKKYAMYEEDIQRIIKEAESYKKCFLNMMDDDALNFLPLSEAYSLPSETDEEKAYKGKELQRCLVLATETPIRIVQCACECVEIFEVLAVKGSLLALSDVGCGIALLRSVVAMGWLNVVTNLNMMNDEKYVTSVKDKLIPMVESAVKRCDKIYTDVLNTI